MLKETNTWQTKQIAPWLNGYHKTPQNWVSKRMWSYRLGTATMLIKVLNHFLLHQTYHLPNIYKKKTEGKYINSNHLRLSAFENHLLHVARKIAKLLFEVFCVLNVKKTKYKTSGYLMSLSVHSDETKYM